MKMYELFLTCPKGLESVCEKDIKHIIKKCDVLDGGLRITGSLKDIYKINLYSRVGMNLLIRLNSFSFTSINDFYKNIYEYDWENLIHPKMTLSISSAIIDKNLLFNNSQFANLKAKDAIVDKIRRLRKTRPSISKEKPVIEIKLIINKKTCSVYLNSSGSPLYKRAYKKTTHKAPLNEVLASGLIYLAKWDKKTHFIDPMCGSGTLCFEAAMIKQNIPSGINRDFSFQKWMNYDNDLFMYLRKKSIKSIKKLSENNIIGYDNNPLNIEGCRETKNNFQYNLQSNFNIKNITNFDSKNKNIVITNPPYEIRIGDEKMMTEIHKGFKKILKTDNELYIIYPIEAEFIKSNYNYKKIADIYNGPIKCGFYKINNA